MPQLYWKAEEPAEIAQTYLKFHADLAGARIAFIFKEKATVSDGRPIIGKPSKVPARLQCLMEEVDGEQGYDFIIEIGSDAWGDLNQDQKAAWIDYLLEQCYGEEDEKTGEMKWKLRRPEVQAFPVILVRHGVNWDTGVNKLAVIDLKTKHGGVLAQEEA